MKQILDKLLWVLKHFESDGAEIIQGDVANEDKTTYSDEYIEKNWKSIISKALENYDPDYENSFQYKLDRAEFLKMKEVDNDSTSSTIK